MQVHKLGWLPVSRQQAPLTIYNGVLQNKRGRNVRKKKVGQKKNSEGKKKNNKKNKKQRIHELHHNCSESGDRIL